jgi:hypothetical protein
VATPLVETWVVRKDASSPWERHDVPLGTKAKMVRKGFELLGRYGTEFEMYPVSALPTDKLGLSTLPGDKVVYMWGGRGKSLETGVVLAIGMNCIYVLHGKTATYAGWNQRVRSGNYVKV